jgi:hypothetical protein
LAGKSLAHDPELERVVRTGTKSFAAAQGIAVHGRSVERRHGSFRDNIPCQHSARSFVERDSFLVQWPEAFSQEGKDLIHLRALLKTAHAHVAAPKPGSRIRERGGLRHDGIR